MHGPVGVYSGFTIRDDDGAWQQIPGLTVHFDDGTTSTATRVLVGSGAYDGLLAIAEIRLDEEIWSWHGWIIDGDLPPMPATPAAIR